MPIITKMEEIPERIIYALLKAGLIAPNTDIQLLPVKKWVFVSCLLDDGFFVVNNAITVYERKILKGLTQFATFTLDSIVQHELIKGDVIVFKMENGDEYAIRIDLPQNEVELLNNELSELISSARS